VFGGQMLKARDLDQQVKRLQIENANLKRQLEEKLQADPSSIKFDVEAQLVELGVQLNTTVRKQIEEAPAQVLQKALASLREAVAGNRASNPSGFFYKSLNDAWQPNIDFERKDESGLFNEWYPLARKAGLVQAATLVKGVQNVLTAGRVWVQFEKILCEYPLKDLATSTTTSATPQVFTRKEETLS